MDKTNPLDMPTSTKTANQGKQSVSPNPPVKGANPAPSPKNGGTIKIQIARRGSSK